MNQSATALANEIEDFMEIVLRSDDGPEWSDKRILSDEEKDLIVAALRALKAPK